MEEKVSCPYFLEYVLKAHGIVMEEKVSCPYFLGYVCKKHGCNQERIELKTRIVVVNIASNKAATCNQKYILLKRYTVIVNIASYCKFSQQNTILLVRMTNSFLMCQSNLVTHFSVICVVYHFHLHVAKTVIEFTNNLVYQCESDYIYIYMCELGVKCWQKQA